MPYRDQEGPAASRLISTESTGGAADLDAPRSVAGPDPIDRVACRLGDFSCANAHASALDRSQRIERSATRDSLLRLQRQYGNRYVGQVLDRARDGESSEGGLDAVERSIDQARGGGQGMDHSTRSRMESSFGADFSGVRIHTDSRADGLSQTLSARAFTTGRDVFFRQGEYSPGTSSGRELLAHELTHVVQQNGDGIRRKMTVSEPGDPHEVEADQMARAVVEREYETMEAIDAGGVATVQRQSEGDNGDSDGPRYPPDWQHGAPTRPVAPDPHVAPDPNRQPEPPDQGPYRNPGLRRRLIEALGIGLGLVAFAALVACFATGVCEAGLVLAAVGAGAFLVVMGILRSMGVGVSGAASTAGGEASGDGSDVA